MRPDFWVAAAAVIDSGAGLAGLVAACTGCIFREVRFELSFEAMANRYHTTRSVHSVLANPVP